MSYMRRAPLGVQQANVWWCWAACFEILNRTYPNKFAPPVRNQNEWLEAMRQSPAASRLLNSQGGINVHYLPAVLNSIRMQSHQWAGTPNNDPANMSYIEEKLRISYLMAVYPVQGGSHFVIVNGIDNSQIYYYNPWASVGNTSATHAQVQSTRLIIAWVP